MNINKVAYYKEEILKEAGIIDFGVKKLDRFIGNKIMSKGLPGEKINDKLIKWRKNSRNAPFGMRRLLKKYDDEAIRRIIGGSSRGAVGSVLGAIKSSAKSIGKSIARETPTFQKAINKLKSGKNSLDKKKSMKFIKNNKGLVSGTLGGTALAGYVAGRSKKEEA